MAILGKRLAGIPSPTIAIVGGSTSALAAAGALLQGLPNETRAPGAITVLHRRALARLLSIGRRTQPPTATPTSGPTTSARSAASSTGSPASERIRANSLMRASGIGGTVARATAPLLHRIDDSKHVTIRTPFWSVPTSSWRRSGIGRGSCPSSMRQWRRRSSLPGVTGTCRRSTVSAASSTPRDARSSGFSAIGLAAGFRPSGKFGGEPSFSGQANGLWLWQTAVGAMLVDALQEASRGPAQRGRRGADPKSLLPPTDRPQHSPIETSRYADNMRLLHCGPALRAANASERDPGASASVAGSRQTS